MLKLIAQKVSKTEDAACSCNSLDFTQSCCKMQAEGLMPAYEILPFSSAWQGCPRSYKSITGSA